MTATDPKQSVSISTISERIFIEVTRIPNTNKWIQKLTFASVLTFLSCAANSQSAEEHIDVWTPVVMDFFAEPRSVLEVESWLVSVAPESRMVELSAPRGEPTNPQRFMVSLVELGVNGYCEESIRLFLEVSESDTIVDYRLRLFIDCTNDPR